VLQRISLPAVTGQNLNLVDEVNDFIDYGQQRELSPLLLKCIRTGGVDALAAVQRLYEDMYGGMTFNTELKGPAAVALLCWRERGLDALVEAAQRTPTFKNQFLAVQVLSSLASAYLPELLLGLAGSDELLVAVRESFQGNEALPSLARQRLIGYILALPTDDDAVSSAGFVLSSFTLPPEMGAAKELVAALASRWLAVSKPTLSAYEELIGLHANDEKQFQAFLTEWPQLLDPMVMQLWPEPDLNGAKSPDFVLRRTDGSYLIVEIETPQKRLVTRDLQISAEASEAISQAMRYRSFLMQRVQQASVHFPGMRDAECLVVVGLERELDEEQKRVLALENEHRHALRVVGFDWLANRAEAIRSNIISGSVTRRRIRMT